MPRERYAVNEVFATIQGEATFTGTPAVFLRLQGCKVGCAFCDTKHTWKTEPRNETSRLAVLQKKGDDFGYWRATPAEIVAEVDALTEGTKCRHVVLTGGEPAEQDLDPLVAELAAHDYTTQIETSGTARLALGGAARARAWITLSPKIGQAGGLTVLREVVAMADEIKHPTATEHHLNDLLALLANGWHRPSIPIWLQPLSASPTATERCVAWCQRHGFRLSLQTHKFIGVR